MTSQIRQFSQNDQRPKLTSDHRKTVITTRFLTHEGGAKTIQISLPRVTMHVKALEEKRRSSVQ